MIPRFILSSFWKCKCSSWFCYSCIPCNYLESFTNYTQSDAVLTAEEISRSTSQLFLIIIIKKYVLWWALCFQIEFGKKDFSFVDKIQSQAFLVFHKLPLNIFLFFKFRMFILNDTWAFNLGYLLHVWKVFSEITQVVCSWSELGIKLLQKAWNFHTHMRGVFNCH